MNGFQKYQSIFVTGWLLALTALVGTGMMAIVNGHSVPFIKNNERASLLRSLNSVLPINTYNNDILNDSITLVDKQYLGSSEPAVIYRARKDDRPTAAALSVIAPNGYSGDIVLLVGIDYAGNITGVRVVKHRETPGLGDGIEIQRSNWIESFTGKSLSHPGRAKWKVKRDGGSFDQFTGATITPRAVVGAVHNALIYFNDNRAKIFSSSQPENKPSRT